MMVAPATAATDTTDQAYSATLSIMKGVSLADVLELDLADRLTLVQAIWDSIAEVPESIPVTAKEREILDQRFDAYRKDGEPGSPWAEVKARLLGE